MPTYLTPGVYVEELPSGVRPIEGVATSIACFVGYTERGPMDDPALIGNWEDYERIFGGLRRETKPVNAQAPMGDPMGHAVSAFFLNGGGKAYVVRLAKGAAAAKGQLSNGGPLLEIEAENPGAWANKLQVQFQPRTVTGEPDKVFEVAVGRTITRGAVTEFQVSERLGTVVPEAGKPNSMETALPSASKLLGKVTVTSGQAAALRGVLEAGTVTVELGNGGNGGAPEAANFTTAFERMRRVRDINIVLLPGQYWKTGEGKEFLEAAITHCEALGDRMVIVDVPPGAELSEPTEVEDLNLTTSTYAVSYYPWPLVVNPYYSPDVNSASQAGPAEPRTVLVSPAAMAAGLWSKTDARRGVWKAPAGIEFGLLGVNALEFTVENTEQDFLNPAGINALRRQPGFGPVVWGARTRATRANPEWRYVPVRRTAIFIEQSVSNAIQWAVFEPNDHRLWSSLRTNVESFMNGLFRSGAFQGEKATDAYFVKCGLGQTMTQDDIDRGQVILLIGFAPLKPAEFVIVRIQQKVGQQ